MGAEAFGFSRRTTAFAEEKRMLELNESLQTLLMLMAYDAMLPRTPDAFWGVKGPHEEFLSQ
jgi:hypothetical protein